MTSLLCVVTHVLWFGVTTMICSFSVVARMPRSMGGWRAAKTEVSQMFCRRYVLVLTCRRAELIFLILLLRTSHPGTSRSVGKDGDTRMDLWKYFTFHQLVAPSCHFGSGHRFLEKLGLRKLKMKTFHPVVGQTAFVSTSWRTSCCSGAPGKPMSFQNKSCDFLIRDTKTHKKV